MVLADHLAESALLAGRVLSLVIPLLAAGVAAICVDVVVDRGSDALRIRRRGIDVAVAMASLVISALLLPGHEALAEWIS